MINTQLRHSNYRKLRFRNILVIPVCGWSFGINFKAALMKTKLCLKYVDKFSYLKILLAGVAFNLVNGFGLSEENYEKAIKLLKQRFGISYQCSHVKIVKS